MEKNGLTKLIDLGRKRLIEERSGPAESMKGGTTGHSTA
jgi:hypothetical protein